MKEEFILDFDNTRTTQDKFNVEIHVNMCVNGREMFRNVDNTIEYPQIPKSILNKLRESINKHVTVKKAPDLPTLLARTMMEQNIKVVPKIAHVNHGVSNTIPVYPREFADWFLRLIPRLDQPYPKKPRAIFNWRMDHEIAAIGCGIVWPDMTIYGKNDMVFIQERPFRYAHDGVVRCSYTECITVTVSKRCFIDGVKAFISKLENTMCLIEDRDLYI